MIDKIKNYLLIFLVVVIFVGYLLSQKIINDYDEQISELKLEKSKELKLEKSIIIKERDSIINLEVKKYDSLLKIKNEIKYIPYEKPIYVNRTLDDAIDVLSNYTYETSRESD